MDDMSAQDQRAQTSVVQLECRLVVPMVDSKVPMGLQLVGLWDDLKVDQLVVQLVVLLVVLLAPCWALLMV
jgi:hypothetical protein